MEKTTWKILAIIFFVICLLQTSLFIWGYVSVIEEEKKINKCYYSICGEYPNADFDSNVCFCYDYDLLGDLMIVKTEVME